MTVGVELVQRLCEQRTAGAVDPNQTPAPLIGLSETDQLVLFASGAPGVVTTRAVTGLQANESLLGVDVRPLIFAISNTSRLYTITLDGFDISGSTGRAYAACTVGANTFTTVYSVSLANGVATPVGATAAGSTFIDIAVLERPGYVLAASDGGAPDLGSLSVTPVRPIVGIAAG